MKYLNTFTLLFALISLLPSCKEDGAKDGDLVTESKISADEFEGFYYEVTEEEDLCNLIDINVLTQHFPGADNYSTSPLGLNQFGINNGGCRLSWRPQESIGRQKADNYYHISNLASIEIKYNVNPDTSSIEGFAHRPLQTKMNPNYQKGPDSLNLDSKYYKVDDLGSFAIWNDGSSSLLFALGEDVLFTIVVKYPKSSDERKEIAKDIANGLIRNLKTTQG